VSSIVGDVLMPPIGLATGGVDFKNLKIALGGTPEAPVTINYGVFLQATIDFIIIAFCVFPAGEGGQQAEEAGAGGPAARAQRGRETAQRDP